MRLYGSDTCPPCKQVRRLLEKFGVPYEYIDVATINYEGEIPLLELDDGTIITSLPGIAKYLRNIRGGY